MRIIEKTELVPVSLIISSVCLLLATLGKINLALTGNYGNELFITLDSISSVVLVIWLFALIAYVSRTRENHED